MAEQMAPNISNLLKLALNQSKLIQKVLQKVGILCILDTKQIDPPKTAKLDIRHKT